MSVGGIDRAMVLAAGLGKRMRPLTDDRPKPLVKLAGRSLLDRALDNLAAGGIKRFVVNSHYKSEMIAAHLANRADITLSPEEILLETGGGVKAALTHLGSDAFFVVNSDAVWRDGGESTIARMAARWDGTAMDALLLLVPMQAITGNIGEHPGDYHLEADGRARRRAQGETAPFLFGGIQILHPRLFEGAPDGKFSLNILYDRAQQAGRLHGLRHDGEWYHVGTPEELAVTEPAFAGNRR
jgi:MurNAc alpha-1-phosphate uridylyltransferase